jgi:hypothetical protein
MCYSVSSSLKTTTISLIAIVYLLSSDIPHFQWIGILLIGWCGMQFAELLLWMTKPRTQCTLWNKIITLTLIPIVLALQPLGSLWGSLYVIPWDNSTDFRKNFIILYSIFIVLAVCWSQFYDIAKTCTTVTPQGHLHWNTTPYVKYKNYNYFVYFLWGLMIYTPLLFWNANMLMIMLLILTPLFGFIYGIYTDGKPSIWCYYTSYTSIVACVLLLLQQTNLYRFV